MFVRRKECEIPRRIRRYYSQELREKCSALIVAGKKSRITCSVWLVHAIFPYTRAAGQPQLPRSASSDEINRLLQPHPRILFPPRIVRFLIQAFGRRFGSFLTECSLIEQFVFLAGLVLSLRGKIILLLFQTCNTTNGKNSGSIESSVRFLTLYDFVKFLSVLIASRDFTS